MLKSYYFLAKPGIIYGNLISTAAGFFVACRGVIDPVLLCVTFAGISGVMGGACVFNNIFDRDIDAKMERTKKRALVVGTIKLPNAKIYGAVLSLIGFALLYFFTNWRALAAALLGFIVYVCLYTPLKRKTTHSTIIGAVAGATPPVVGYCAVAGRFDLLALMLFLFMLVWQMPHFFSIAIFRINDYVAAGIPTFPVRRGIFATKIAINIYISLFTAICVILARSGAGGISFLSLAILLCGIWLVFGLRGFRSDVSDTQWARRMFRFSLIVMTFLSIALSIGGIIHT